MNFLDYEGLKLYDSKIKQWVKTTAVEQVSAAADFADINKLAPIAKLANTIVQYVGVTTTDFINGYFYKCVERTDVSGTYEWKQVNVQPGASLTDIIDDTAAATVTNKAYSAKKVHDVVNTEAKDGIYKPESSEGADDAVTIEKAIKALEDATFLCFRGTTTAAIDKPEDGDLYYFNIAATESDPAVIGWKFYSATDAAWKDLNDATVSVRVNALETQIGKNKEVNAYTEKADLVDIVNILTADDSVVGSVAKVVKDAVKDLEGAMHFKAVVTPDRTGENPQTDEDAMNAWYAAEAQAPAPGDVFVVSDNAKEYIVSAVAESGEVSYREIGDEGLYVQKTTTIAGVDLQDDITKEELLTALEIAAIPDADILKLFNITD